jgi:hypothetical protein
MSFLLNVILLNVILLNVILRSFFIMILVLPCQIIDLLKLSSAVQLYNLLVNSQMIKFICFDYFNKVAIISVKLLDEKYFFTSS